MVNNSEKMMGFYGNISLITGIASCFFGGLFSVFIGFSAVAAGFWGAKKRQKFSQTGMIAGSLALIFFNLVSIGIVSPPSRIESSKKHLVNAINASIKAFDILRNGKFDDDEKEKLIIQFKNGLAEATMVAIKEIDSQVPGFELHFKNEFINGMQLLIEGYEEPDTAKKLNGGLLMDKWGKWNNENNTSLGKIKEPPLPLFFFLKEKITR